jgi:hypothetical protein
VVTPKARIDVQLVVSHKAEALGLLYVEVEGVVVGAAISDHDTIRRDVIDNTTGKRAAGRLPLVARLGVPRH